MSDHGTPQITPYVLYEDVAGALGWLDEAFGFSEVLRYEAEDGTVNHAEMRLGEGAIMLGDPGDHYRNPKQAGGCTTQIHVYVDDVDAHFARARNAGAAIVQEPTDQPYGDRRYDVEDVEGHRWSFAQRLREVPAEEWGAKVR